MAEPKPTVDDVMALVSEYGQCRWSEGSSGATFLDRMGERRSREESADLYQQIRNAVDLLAEVEADERIAGSVTIHETIPPLDGGEKRNDSDGVALPAPLGWWTDELEKIFTAKEGSPITADMKRAAHMALTVARGGRWDDEKQEWTHGVGIPDGR